MILVANSWQERFDSQLAQTARNFTGALAQIEVTNIDFLAQVAFTAANNETKTPAIADAIRTNDASGLRRALEVFYRREVATDNLVLDRLIAFDTKGMALVDWERNLNNPNVPSENLGTNLAGLDIVQRVVQGISEGPLDKYSALIRFHSFFTGDSEYHFFTVVPVRSNGQIVGGLLIASRLNNLLNKLQIQSQSSISTIYDTNGFALGSTAPMTNFQTLDMSPTLLDTLMLLNKRAQAAQDQATPANANQTTDVSAKDLCLDIGNLPSGLQNPLNSNRLPACSVKEQQTVRDGRVYEFVYAPLLIRGAQAGFFSISLSRDFIVSAWSSSRWAIIGVTAFLAVGAVLVGVYVANQITHPLNELVATASAVSHGDLERRSMVRSTNELGTLSLAFNQMTEHLLRLYTVSRDLNQAIEVYQVLDVTTEAAQAFAPRSEAIAILEEEDAWVYHTRSNPPETLAFLKAIQLDAEHPFRQLIAAQQGFVTYVAPDDPALQPAGLSGVAGFATVLTFPVTIQNRVAGALLIAHPDRHAFGEGEEQGLRAVANMSVSVLHNATLYTRVQKDARERQAILTSIGDGVVVCDKRGRIVLLNPIAQEMLNINDWDTRSYLFHTLPLEPLESNREVFGTDAAQEQYRLGTRIVSRTDSPLISQDGHAIGQVIILHDITAAVAVDKAKTDFIATASHELRTPLTVITGYIELMLRGTFGKLNEDQAQYLELVRSRASDMTNLVQNMIAIADIESGRLNTDLQPIDVLGIVESALRSMRQAFTTKGLAVSVDIPTDLSPVLADREQFKRALSQMLDNARRYTQTGSVTVRAVAEDLMVRVDVIDTGPGIEPDVMSRLFTRFQRVEGNNSAERGGGLGLAIARQVIERQGGHVAVSSTLGAGSVFSIFLPRIQEHALAVAQTEAGTTTTT